MATLQRRRNQLAGYCKLVIYGILDLSTATDVFKYYSKVEETEGSGERESERGRREINRSGRTGKEG